MNRSKRTIVPSLKVIENNTPIIKTIKKKVKKPVNTLNLDLSNKITYDRYEPDNDFYKQYMVSPDDDLKNKLNNIIDKYGDRLQDAYSFHNDIVNLDIKNKEQPKLISYNKLKNGDYHTPTSKSDKNIAKNIKTIVNNLPSFKQYKDVDNLNWIIDNHRLLLLEILEYHYNNNNSLATIKTNINVLCRIIGLSYNKQYPLYIKYTTILLDLGKVIDENEGKNALNDNEKGRFIDWNIVLREQKIIESKFNALQNKLSKDAYDLNQDLLLISLYTLIPPLRAEIKTLKFTSSREDVGDWVYFYNNDVYLELNEIKKRHDYIRLELPEHLANILKESYKLYNRDAVFTLKGKYPDVSKQASVASLDDRLAKMFYKYGVKIGSSILRSSFVSHIFKKHLTYNEKMEIARKMRTSFKQLHLSYNKNIADAIPITNIGIQRANVVIPVVRNIRPIKSNPYQKQLDRNRKYYNDNKEEILKKQKEQRANLETGELYRRRIIGYLNNDSEYKNKIRKTTIDKYNIKVDKDGKYF
jgi:hypothetical protein